MHSTRLVPFLAAVALVACGEADARTALNEPTIDTLPGGIVQVSNPGPTLWADTSGWRIVSERVIAPAEGSPGELSDARRLVADAHGNVYVMQREPVVIKVFGPDGQWLRNIGREGDGPGEFRDGMLGINGDTLIIQDPNNQRLTTFLTDGTFLGTAQSQCCWFSSSFPVLDNGLAMIMGPPPAGVEHVQGAYYLTRMDGTIVDTILRPEENRAREENFWIVTRKSKNGTSSMWTDIPGRPQDVERWRSDGRHVVGNTADYRLAIVDGFSDTLRIFTATAPRLHLTDAERDSIFEHAIEDQSEEWRESVREIADLGQIPGDRPLWSRLATDREHRIWVGLPGPGADVASLDVFSPEGVLLGRVPAPHANILEGFWTDDHVYLRDDTDLGLPIIRVFRIEKTAR